MIEAIIDTNLNTGFMPKITVITVVYNDKINLEKTIQSIINQTYKNIEYIIIDGGSTDGTIDIIKKYSGEISYWVSEPDKGIYDAMNKGVKMASGEYVNFMNSGDSFYSEYIIEKLIKEINSNTDFFYGNVELICGNYRNGNIKTANGLKNIKKGMPFCHQAVFVRKRILINNPFDLKFKISADYLFFLELNKNGGFQDKYINEVICFYDMEGISVKIDGLIENLSIIMKYYPLSPIVIYHLFLLIAFIMYQVYLKIVPKRLRKKIHNFRVNKLK